MKRLIVALLFTAALARVQAQPEGLPCPDDGDCYARRSATAQIRAGLAPRLLVKTGPKS